MRIINPEHTFDDEVQRVYAFVCQYIHTERRPPTQREIAEGTYMGRTNAVRCLDVLVARGLLLRTEHVARGLSLPPESGDGDDSA